MAITLGTIATLLSVTSVPGDASAASPSSLYDMRSMLSQPHPFAGRPAAIPSPDAQPRPVTRSAETNQSPRRVPAPTAGDAATPASGADGGVWKLEFQNEDRGPLEGFMGNNETGHLTWGWRVAYTPDAPDPEWFDWLRDRIGWWKKSTKARVSYGVEQSASVPNSIRRDNDLIDKPAVGLLMGGARVMLAEPFDGTFQEIDYLDLSVGLAGPASGAEIFHRVSHSMVGRSSRGWENSIKSEPVFLVRYEKGLRAIVGWDGLLEFETYPLAGVSLGNAFTDAFAALSFRVGGNLRRDGGPPRMLSALSGETFPEKGDYWTWSLFAGTKYKAVGWNVYSDGNTYTDTTDVTTKPFTSEILTGAEVGYGAYRLTLVHVYRVEEFEEQFGQDRFIRLGFSAAF